MPEVKQNAPLSLDEILAGIQSDFTGATVEPPPEPPQNVAVPFEEIAELEPDTHVEERADKPAVGKVFRLVSNIVFAVVCITLVIGSILFAFSNDPGKSYFGFRIYNVLTKSMTPKEDGSSLPGGFEQGAVILVKMCKAEEIKVGDVITFNPGTHDVNGTSFLTHRVIEIKTALNGKQGIFFVTQGDANNSPDPPISGNMIIGKKVFHIPHAGSALQWIRSNFILSMIILISFFMSIFFFRWCFAKPEEEEQSEAV